MKKYIDFICIWKWVDFSRLFKKSHGINGFIQSLKFYWNVYNG